MRFPDLMARAGALDAADPLGGFRARLKLPDGPDGKVYLDGNSLGALPLRTIARMREVLEDEWGEGLVGSWNAAGWIDAPARIGAMIAPLVGAQPHEVTVCDSVSVNLFKLVVAALRLRPGRSIVLVEKGDFPTDRHMAEGAAAVMGAEVRALARDRLLSHLGPDVALVLLSHVNYRTAAIHDLAGVTAAAHASGVLVLWDLSHSTGAVEVALGAADFAVGCGYKFLHGGPGAPAFAFVAHRHQHRLDQPLAGWMGHAEPFAFEDRYRPAQGVRRLLAGTPPILALAALEEGVRLVCEAGARRCAQKARALGDLFIACLDSIADPQVRLVSPRDGRGGHVTFAHPRAFALVQALIARGVIGDFRAPDAARFGFSPLSLRHADVVRAASILADVLAAGDWREAQFSYRPSVT